MIWDEVDPTGSQFADALVGKVIAGGPGVIAFGQDQVTLTPIVWTSADGQNWTREETSPDVFGGGVPDQAVQAGDVAIALGYRASLNGTSREIWLSTDGRTWTRDLSATGRFGTAYVRLVGSADLALAYGGDGYREIVLRSSDGAHWVAVPEFQTAFGHQPSFSSVIAERGGFLAVGVTGSGSGPFFHEWVSADGLSWQEVPVDPATPGESFPGTVYRTPFGLLLFGQGLDPYGTSINAAWISDDGRSWRSYPSTVGLDLGDLSIIAAHEIANAEFVVTEDYSGDAPVLGLVVSHDGRVWHQVDSPGPSDLVTDWSRQSSAWDGGVLVFGYDPAAGRTRGWLGHIQWDGAESASPPASPASSAAPTASPAPQPVEPAPPIGLQWQPLLGPRVFGLPGDRGAMVAATSFAGGVVAVGTSRGHAMTWASPDGIHWQRAPAQSILDRITLLGVEAGRESVVAVGFSGEPPDAVSLVSADGLHWEVAPTTEALRGARMNAIAASSAGFVAVGTSADESSPRAWTSTDGRTWIAATVAGAAGLSMAAVVSSEGGLVAGGAGQHTAQLWTSTDGMSWAPVSTSAFNTGGDWYHQGSVTGMVASGARILAVGQVAAPGTIIFSESAVFESTDGGRSWQRQPRNPLIADTDLSAIVHFADGYVIGGTERFNTGGRAMILTSADGLDWVAADSVALNGPDPAPPALRSIAALAPTGDRLVAVGQAMARSDNDSENGSTAAVWLGAVDATILPDDVCPTGNVTMRTLLAMSGADRVVCLGGQRLSFRAWLEEGGCARQLSLISSACGFGGAYLTLGPSRPDSYLDFRAADGVDVFGPGWVDVVGRYDDPSSADCLFTADVAGYVHYAPAVADVNTCRAQLFVDHIERAHGH